MRIIILFLETVHIQMSIYLYTTFKVYNYIFISRLHCIIMWSALNWERKQRYIKNKCIIIMYMFRPARTHQRS